MTLIKNILTCLNYLFIPRSYSQLGEDLVILNHLEWLGKNISSPGFYVDIGGLQIWYSCQKKNQMQLLFN